MWPFTNYGNSRHRERVNRLNDKIKYLEAENEHLRECMAHVKINVEEPRHGIK